MNTFEIPKDSLDIIDSQSNKKMADLAIAEIRKKIEDQILFLKDNSKDVNLRHHLSGINKENKELLLKSLFDQDVIDFNEVVLKGSWKKYLEKFKEEKLTKYKKDEIDEPHSATLKKDSELRNPAEEFKLSFRAMIDHYAKNLEIEEYEMRKETERQILKKEFADKLKELEKHKPHIVAEIKGIDFNIFRKPDYEVALNLNEDSLNTYENGLKKYFDIKLSSNTENRSREIKIDMIQNDPRFRYYCALKQIIDPGPCEPHIFIL